jgi:hypothetical protein
VVKRRVFAVLEYALVFPELNKTFLQVAMGLG